MFAQALVFAGLVLAEPPAAAPRLDKGLEARWTGTFTEASFRPGVRAARTYDVDTRLFVLDAGEHGANAALFTRVYLRPDRKSTDPPAGVVRLDLVQIDPRGKVQVLPSPADPDNPDPKLRPWPQVQLQGLPTHEAGMFVELPDKPFKPGLAWSRDETGRPAMSWKGAELETFHGHPALKLVGEQTTTGYYADRVRQPEWRRQDTLSVVPGRGYASKIERIIEKRDTDADDLSFRSVLTLEHQGKVVYSGRLYQERRDEVVHAAAFTAMLDRLLANGGRDGAKPFEALARRCQTYLSDHGASDTVPYREAILAVRKRAESAAKGNLPPVPPPDSTPDPLTVGQRIPDVTATGITVAGSTRLSALKGKPVVLAYFQPSAASAPAVLKLADELNDRKLGAILPLAIGDPAQAKKVAADEKVVAAVYDGSEVYKTHGLTATPVFVVVDKDGVIRSVTRGWGGETAATARREVERWQK